MSFFTPTVTCKSSGELLIQQKVADRNNTVQYSYQQVSSWKVIQTERRNCFYSYSSQVHSEQEIKTKNVSR